MVRVYLVMGILLCAFMVYANSNGLIIWDAIFNSQWTPGGPGNHTSRTYHK